MKRSLLSAMTLVAFGLINSLSGQDGRTFRLSFTTEGQYLYMDSSRPAKFFRFRDIPNNLVLSDVTALYNNPTRNSRFFFSADDALQQDQKYYFWGSAGPYTAYLVWDQTPFFQFSAARTPFQLNSNQILPVPGPYRTQLQALQADAAGTRSVVESSVPDFNVTDIRSRRDALKVEQRLNATDNLILRFDVRRHRQNGRRTIGTGSYERTSTPTGDLFEAIGIELPAYMDQATVATDLGIVYRRGKLFFEAAYKGSVFHNEFDAIRWENPFRITNAQAAPPSGGLERGRFAVGQLATHPDNQRHGATWVIKYLFSENAVLSWHSTFARTTQDESFLPYTLNAAVTQTSVNAPITSVDALPKLSLDGEVHNWKQELRFALEPADLLDVNLKYRFLRYDNRSPDIHFPGYVGFADSFWRTGISTTIANVTEPIESIPQDYTKQNAIVESHWSLSDSFGFELGYELEAWNRQLRNVSRSNEHRVSAAIDFKRGNTFHWRTGYQRWNRTNQGYDPGILEYELLRSFDQHERDRDRAEISIRYSPTARSSFGLSGHYYNDDYEGDLYGLVHDAAAEVGLDFQYLVTETFSLNGNYAHEHRRGRLNSIAKTASPSFKVADTWVRDLNDNFDTLGAGFRADWPDRKVAFSLFYGLAFTENQAHADNPYTPTTTNALAFDFPDVEERFHDVELEVEFSPSPNLKWGFRALVEPYRLDDFAWDGLQPYMQGLVADQVNRFLFLDAKYDTYTAGVASVYLNYGF